MDGRGVREPENPRNGELERGSARYRITDRWWCAEMAVKTIRKYLGTPWEQEKCLPLYLQV